MKNLGYYNGKIDELENCFIPMLDRAFYFGDGVYDAVMCRNNIPYLLSDHIDRFFKNCKQLGILIPQTKNDLSALILSLCRLVEAEEKFVYFHCSRGTDIVRSHLFPKGKEGNLCVMIIPMSIEPVSEKMKCITDIDLRYHYCNCKTLNLLPSVLSANKAEQKGAQESIFIREGFVTEGSHCNVSILKNGVLKTAPTDEFILPGVARAELLRVCKENKIKVREEHFPKAELFSADEIIITSSSKICRGVCRLDRKKVGGKDESTLRFLQDTLYQNYLNATSV